MYFKNKKLIPTSIKTNKAGPYKFSKLDVLKALFYF
jgi:hypothetical protein